MIDLETLGNTSGSVITSIGAVQFDLDTGDIGSKFYIEVNIQNALNEGLTVDGSTIEWWMKQSDDARKLIHSQKNPQSLKDALEKLKKFIYSVADRDDVVVWGNSARFDLGILADAHKIINKPVPWSFRNERCVRTLVAFKPEIKKNMKFEGVMHDPIDDCLHQIKYCSEIWNSFK